VNITAMLLDYYYLPNWNVTHGPKIRTNGLEFFTAYDQFCNFDIVFFFGLVFNTLILVRLLHNLKYDMVEWINMCSIVRKFEPIDSNSIYK
jgi:hypothetical protein